MIEHQEFQGYFTALRLQGSTACLKLEEAVGTLHGIIRASKAGNWQEHSIGTWSPSTLWGFWHTQSHQTSQKLSLRIHTLAARSGVGQIGSNPTHDFHCLECGSSTDSHSVPEILARRVYHDTHVQGTPNGNRLPGILLFECGADGIHARLNELGREAKVICFSSVLGHRHRN